MNRRAFTLIELLVVIAIIAILAAILFPVFAQAKLQAKAAASISNHKQIAMASQMYGNDADDYLPITTAWNTGNDPLCVGSACFSTWVWLTAPYMKNGQIQVDPTGPAMPSPAGWPQLVSASINGTYGYNYTCLNPWSGVGTAVVLSTTSLSNPANTVEFSSKWAPAEWQVNGTTTDSGGNWVVDFGGYGAGTDNGPMLNVTVDPPNCYTIPAYCLDNWGAGGAWSTWMVGKATVPGGNSGGNSARAPQNADGVMSFCDGHAKKLSWSAEAVGTNWNINLPVASLKVTNVTTYMWYAQQQ